LTHTREPGNDLIAEAVGPLDLDLLLPVDIDFCVRRLESVGESEEQAADEIVRHVEGLDAVDVSRPRTMDLAERVRAGSHR
jgi:hypothetical protein